MGKPTNYKWPFSIAMLVHQRVGKITFGNSGYLFLGLKHLYQINEITMTDRKTEEWTSVRDLERNIVIVSYTSFRKKLRRSDDEIVSSGTWAQARARQCFIRWSFRWSRMNPDESSHLWVLHLKTWTVSPCAIHEQQDHMTSYDILWHLLTSSDILWHLTVTTRCHG